MPAGPGNAFGKVFSGDPLDIPAEAYNAFIDAALDLRQRLARGGEEHERFFRNPCVIKVHNTSGATVDRFGILGIDDALILPADNLEEFKSQPMVVGVTPAADHAGKFVVLIDPLEDDKIGRAVAAGVTICQVDIVDEGHPSADVVDGETEHLESADTGAASILWAEPGTGVKWAMIRFGAGGGGGGGSLTVKEKVGSGGSDGTSVTEVTELRFDIDSTGDPDPFDVISDGVGIARVKLTGFTGSKTVVTDVICTASGISKTTETWNFVAGILKSIT